MATKEQVYKATILINSEQAQNNIAKLEKQLDEVKRRRDKALTEGKIDVWKSANKEIDSINKKLEKQRSIVTAQSKTIENISTAKAKELRTLIGQINKELDSPHIKKGSEEWKALVAVLKDAKTELKKITEATREQESAWGKFTGFLNKNWGAITQIFGAVTGISATIRSAVNDYATMEEEMANTRKYTGMTAEQVRDLNEEFKKMDTRTSREQLNQLAGSAGRLGITSKQGILDFVDAADKISVALGDDLGENAVDQIGKLAMAFGEDEKLGLRGAMLATGSAINELAQNSAANAGYLVEFTARVAGVGKQLGLTQSQIMGFGAVMDENLLKDEMSSTAFSQMITKMATDASKFAKFAGMEADKFTKLVKEDMNGAILALADNMRKQDPSNMLKMFGDMGLDGSRAIGVLTNMADKIDDVRKHQKTATEAYEEGTSVISEFTTMNDTAEARMEKVKKAFKEMTVELGARLLPVVKYTISAAGLLAKGLNVLTSFVAKNWKAIVTLASGIVTYYIAVNIATIKEKAHAAAVAVSNGYLKAKIALTKAWAVANTAAGLTYDLLTGKIKIATYVQEMHNRVVKANPYVAAAAAVMTLVGAIINLLGKTEKLTKAQKAIKDATSEAEKEIAEEKASIDALLATARDKALADDVRQEAIDKLKSQYPEYLSGLQLEKIYTQEAAKAVDELTDSLISEAKARILARKIAEAEEKKRDLDENFFKETGGILNLNDIWRTIKTAPAAIFDVLERGLNSVQSLLGQGNFSGWNWETASDKNGWARSAAESYFQEYEEERTAIAQEIDALTNELKKVKQHQAETRTQRHPKPEGGGNDGTDSNDETYRTEAEIREELAEREKRLKELKKQEEEEKKILKERADVAKATYQEQLAYEMLAYRQGKTAYTEYMEKKHTLTQTYYDQLKLIYGENSKEYKKALLQQEQDETEYNSWRNKQKDDRYLLEKYNRDHNIRMRFALSAVKDEDALNEQLFRSDIEYLKQKKNLYRKGSKERIEIEQQISQKEHGHQLELEQRWMQRLQQFREQTGRMDYDKLQEIELKGAETFYGAMLKQGQMTKNEYDSIIEYIRRKYAELKAEQSTNKDVQSKASKSLATSKKNAGVKDFNGGNDVATGIFAVSQAVQNQKLINDQLKLLYGEDYENNREYQEAKRQLDTETMQQIVAGAQAAYSSINSLMSAASSYAQACSDLEVAKITANYDKQIEAAGKNSKKRERLEKQKDEAIAKAKTKANKKAMAMEIAQAIAQTAMGAISAYSLTMAGAPYPANLVLAPISAGIALAAGALQIATIKKQHEAEAAGYYEGGFTGGRQYRKEAGVVHEGEFVANHQAVNNRQLMPVFSLLDQAQRNNRVASLRAEDVTNVMGGPASQAIVPIVNVQAPNNSELSDTLEMVRETQDRLATQLEQGIGVDIPIDGENGMYRRMKRYENLLKNK